MNVFAVYSVNEHIAELLAEAEAARLAKLVEAGAAKRREHGPVASWVRRVRDALTPPVSMNAGYPSRS